MLKIFSYFGTSYLGFYEILALVSGWKGNLVLSDFCICCSVLLEYLYFYLEPHKDSTMHFSSCLLSPWHLLSICMYCVSIYLWGNTCLQMCMCTRSPECDSDCFSHSLNTQLLLPLLLQLLLLLLLLINYNYWVLSAFEPELNHLGRLASESTWGSSCLCLPYTKSPSMYLCIWHFTLVLEIELRPSCLQRKHFTGLIRLSPKVAFWKCNY